MSIDIPHIKVRASKEPTILDDDHSTDTPQHRQSTCWIYEGVRISQQMHQDQVPKCKSVTFPILPNMSNNSSLEWSRRKPREEGHYQRRVEQSLLHPDNS